MSAGKWNVYKQPIGTAMMYSVLRIRDESQPMHSGNVDSEGCFVTKEEAQALADKLNRKEEENGQRIT